MRTRRRPVLRDKTPVNTPQKPRAPAKPRLVPVVEIKTRLRRTGKGKQTDNEHEPAVDAGDIEEPGPELQEAPAAAPKPRSPARRERTRPSATAKGGRGKGAGTLRRNDAGRQPVSEKEGAARLAVGDRGDGPGNEHSVDHVVDADASIPTQPVTRTGKRKRTNAQEPVAINAGATSATIPKPAKIRKTVATIAEAPEPEPKNTTRSKLIRGHKNQDDSNNEPTTRHDASEATGIQKPTAARHHVEPTGPSRKGKARANDEPAATSAAKDNLTLDRGGGDRVPLRHISPAPSPSAGRKVLPIRQRKPLQPTSVPSPQRANTPDTIPIADDDSSQSDAIKAIFDTPSPARIIRAPIPAQSTPMGGRLEKQFSPLPPLNVRGRQQSSIRRWNHGVSRAYSPLPPSSPPPLTPPTQEPVAGSSRLQPLSQPHPEEDNDYYMENEPPRGPTYIRKERLSDDDPFGILAAEKKLKALRERRAAAMAESSRAPGVVRAPLGTLALDEVPSSDVRIPEHLPTPLPSDDDHNIDDLYLDVDPRPARMVLDEEYDDEEDEDKENIPTADYDLNEDKENLRPPRLFNGKDRGSELPSLDLSLEGDSDAENGPLPLLGEAGDLPIAPLLAASAKKGLTALLEPSSSSGSPTHALRTPHKHRNAHKRSPLPTPNFSDTPLTARSADRRDSSPSPVKPSVARAGPSVIRKPLAPIEIDDAPEDSEEPPKVAGQKRTRAQAAIPSGSDSDPRAAVRRLESLLPKRSKIRVAATVRGTAPSRGRGRATVAKGKARAAPVESTSGGDDESDAEEDSDSSPPKAKKAKTTRGTGRGRETSRGRPQGRSAAPVSTRGRSAAPVSTRGRSAVPVSASGRPASKRGQSTSKGKGKERAEEIDPEEDEERARKREERLEYFRQLQEYSIEKEDVYVI